MANELEIRAKLKEYLTLLESNGAIKGSEEHYADYVISLSVLNHKIDEFYTPNNDGEYPKLSGNALNDIIGSYNQVLKQGQNLRNMPAVKSGDRFRAEISTVIDDFLSKDLNTLVKINPEDEKTLPECISNARTKTVDLTGKQLKKVGASSSVRLPFSYTDSDNKEISGFFTEKATLQTKEELLAKDNALMLEKYPNEADLFFSFQTIFEDWGICSQVGVPGEPIEQKQIDTVKCFLSNNTNWKEEISAEEAKQRAENLMTDNNFLIHLREYGKLVDSKANDRIIRSQILQSKLGYVMDARNSGMSIVANLLGVGDVIAHSEPMKIIIDGREIEGTFMRTAQGKDINNIAADDALTTISYDQLNQTKPKKQMADLMVLDYICGNADRHAANIFYQTDEKGNLTGIIGIDNDMSFPAHFNKDTGRTYGLNDTSLNNIKTISSEMAEHVMNLSPEILKASLRGIGLTNNELDVAALHLTQIQDRIARDIDYYKEKAPGKVERGHIRIIDDYSTISLNELSLRDSTKEEMAKDANFKPNPNMVEFSPLGRLYNLDKYAAASNHPSPETLAQRQALPKGSELQLHEELNEDIYRIGSYKTIVSMMKSGLELVDPKTVRSSSEFKAMKACLNELNRQLQSIPVAPDKSAIAQLRNTYSDLARLSQNYIDKKSKEKNRSDTANTRMNMAERINNLASTHLANFEQFVKKQVTSLDTSDAKLEEIDFFDGIDTEGEAREPYVQAFDTLKNAMEPYLTLNEEGTYHALEQEDIDELKTYTEGALNETLNYLSAHEGDPNYVGKMDLLYKVQKNLMKDYMALQSAKPGTTLSNLLTEANGRTVDVTGHIAKTTGNMLSSRRQLSITGPDGKIVNGFFTEREYIGKAGIDKIVRTFTDLYPQYSDEISRYGEFMSVERGKSAHEEFFNNMVSDHAEDFEFSKAFTNMKQAISAQCTKSGNYIGMMYDETSSPIDTRNTAMSDIANTLGIGNVIAQSTEMKLKDGDKIIEGTFMINAEGEDFAHLKENNSFKDCKENWLDNSPVLRQMSDLNVLDYLCMNIDRHNKNIFYKFDKTDPSNPKLIGITGIDNDMSFAPINPTFGMIDGCSYNLGIDGITCISQDLAEAVTNLKPSMLKGILEMRGMTKDHVDGACLRLSNLKNALKENKIPVLSDEEFLKHKASDFTVKNGQQVKNVFSVVSETRTQYKGLMLESDKPKANKDVVDLYEKVNNLMISQDNDLLKDLKLDLQQATVGVFGGSKEFSKVQESIDMLFKANKIMSSDPNKTTVKNISNLKTSYCGVLANCMEYMERKNKQGKYFAPNTKDGRRIQAVRKVIDFCKNRSQCLGEVVKRADLQKSNVRENTLQNNKQKDTTFRL